jgi:hypothetical protein
MRGFFGLAALFVVVGCATSVPPQPAGVAEDAPERRDVGKHFWMTGAAMICATPQILMGRDCEVPGHHADVLITDVVADPQDKLVSHYKVLYGSGKVGYIMTSNLRAHATDVDPKVAAAECKRRGDPRIGMTSKQVTETCWGKPDQVNRTETALGITDQYVYEGRGYVYLRNGVVTSVQTTGTLR